MTRGLKSTLYIEKHSNSNSSRCILQWQWARHASSVHENGRSQANRMETALQSMETVQICCKIAHSRNYLRVLQSYTFLAIPQRIIGLVRVATRLWKMSKFKPCRNAAINVVDAVHVLHYIDISLSPGITSSIELIAWLWILQPGFAPCGFSVEYHQKIICKYASRWKEDFWKPPFLHSHRHMSILWSNYVLSTLCSNQWNAGGGRERYRLRFTVPPLLRPAIPYRAHGGQAQLSVQE